MPASPLPGLKRAKGAFANSFSAASSFFINCGCSRRALAGRTTRLYGSFMNSRLPFGAGMNGPKSTMPLMCDTRVVRRIKNGTFSRSDMSNAAITRSFASWGVAGSTIGIYASFANSRLSCSFCDEWQPGSSADIIMVPPRAPRYANVMNASAATFRPTCFMLAMVRCPEWLNAITVSIAAFSFTAYSKRNSGMSPERKTL